MRRLELWARASHPRAGSLAGGGRKPQGADVALVVGHHHRVSGGSNRQAVRARAGFIVTTLLGIVGAIFAEGLGQRIGWYAPGQNAGFIGAIVGAVLILAIYRAIIGSPG